MELHLVNGTMVQFPALETFGAEIATLVLRQDSNHRLSLIRVEEMAGNRVKMFYQIPQYVVITVAEILISVTGLSFFYSQAPESMKSLVAAMWLMTTAFGNVIVMIVAEVRLLPKQVCVLV